MGGREAGEGGGFWVIGYDMTVSPLPAHGGQCFLILVLVATRSFCLSQGRETGVGGGERKKKRSCPSPHDSLDLFAYPPSSGKADTHVYRFYAPWEPPPFTSK